MTDKILLHRQPLISVSNPAPASSPVQPTAKGPGFEQLLQQQITGLKFSQHAKERLATRNITLTPADMQKIGSAVDKAAAKGAQESLILLNNLALVVSVKNRTVVTAIDSAQMKEHVFTNIDSAVIV